MWWRKKRLRENLTRTKSAEITAVEFDRHKRDLNATQSVKFRFLRKNCVQRYNPAPTEAWPARFLAEWRGDFVGTLKIASEGGYFCGAKTKKSGAFSFGYFSLDKQRKVTRPEGRNRGQKSLEK